MHLGKNIKLIREAEGLSQEEFGKKVGVSRDAVYTYESRNTSPKQVVLNRIVSEFGVPLDVLINAELTEDAYNNYKRLHLEKLNLNDEEVSYSKNGKSDRDYIISLEKGLSTALEQISQLQKNLDTLLRRQQVIAAMNDASLEALLFDLADRKELDRGEVRRSVRNRAFSKLDQFEIKGIEIETYT